MLTDDAMRRLKGVGRTEALAGRFELVTEAGRGGMGTVYRAIDREGGRPVAVKILLEEAGADVGRFLREAELLERLEHPRIVRYLAHGRTEEGEPYLVMEWLEGETLSERLRRGRLESDETITLGIGACEALEAAHAAGVVHRDLKPANLFLPAGRLEEVKLLDFGIARDLSPGGAGGATATGVLLGTVGYLAPEQARDSKRVDARADLFSLGCVLYRARTGVSPFGAEHLVEAIARVLTEDPEPVQRLAPDTAPALARLIHDLLAREPAERPPSAAAVRQRLEDARRDPGSVPKPLAATRVTPRGRASLPSSPDRATSAWAPWLGAAAASAVALAVMALVTSPEPPPERAATVSSAPSTRSACRAWAELLASMQSESGAFGVERHRDASGWATAQALAALGRAASCAPATAEARDRGLAALEAFVTEEGTRAGDLGSAVETGATAWTVLAWLASGEPERIERARRLGARLRAAEGPAGFCVTPSCTDRSAYVGVLATWALVELARHGEPAAPTAWLERALRSGEGELATTDGLAEQAYVVLEAGGGASAAVRAVIADRLSRTCALEGDRCTRSPGTVGATYLDHAPGRGPNLVTFWFPWSLAAAAQLERALPSEASEVRRVAAAHRARAAAGLELLDAAPVYEVAEFLLAVAIAER